ncbi:MAG: FG-GAP-like repeat-containing protein, partial [Blastocatellia bacterium]
LAVGDFNRDGKADIVTANGGSNNLTILLNNCPFSTCINTNFAPGGSNIPVDTFPNQIAIGDFNNDGRLDLAVADEFGGDVTILLGDGAGGFANNGSVTINQDDLVPSVVVGDFNRDGKQDLAVCTASGKIAILIGNGDGTFKAPVNAVDIGGSTFPLSIAVGDFNNDGKLDLATTNRNGSIAILLGDGSGGFSQTAGAPLTFVANFPTSLQVGDFNRDGKQDLAFVDFNGGNAFVLLGDGKGGFSEAPGSPFASGVASESSLAIGDFNQDGKQDLAISCPGGTIGILLGDGAGHFAQAPGSPISLPGTGPRALAIGDFNGDGKQDIVFTNITGIANDFTDILLGDGTGRFSRPANSTFVVGNSPGFVAVGDFNQDGKDDLVVADVGLNQVNVVLNTCMGDKQPTITASAVSRTAGNPSSNSQIATVSDIEDAANTLAITVNAGASATLSGVTVSGISVDAAGLVTADMVAVCGATTANFTLRVTNSRSLFTEATLTVTVTPDNSASVASSPMNQTVC